MVPCFNAQPLRFACGSHVTLFAPALPVSYAQEWNDDAAGIGRPFPIESAIEGLAQPRIHWTNAILLEQFRRTGFTSRPWTRDRVYKRRLGVTVLVGDDLMIPPELPGGDIGNATGSRDLAVIIECAFPWEDGGQSLWLPGGDQPLIDRMVRGADQANLTCAPRLVRRPVDQGCIVFNLARRKRVEHSGRRACPTGVCGDDDVTILDPALRVGRLKTQITARRLPAKVRILREQLRP